MTTTRAPASFRGEVLRSAARRVLSMAGFVILSLFVIVGLWAGFVKGLHLDSFGTKTPAAVWQYWTSGSQARDPIINATYTTLEHAGIGYVAGTILGVVLATAFVSFPRVESVTMPLVLFLQTVPILVILPLLILLFGQGMLVTAVITTLVVFFPTIIWVSQGLRSPLATTFDYFRSCNASSMSILLKLRVPSAVPSLFVAARMSVPGAIFGAFVSEWLATGNGLGYLVVNAVQSSYAQLWTVVAVTTLVTMLAYVAVETVESFVLAHYAPERLLEPGH